MALRSPFPLEKNSVLGVLDAADRRLLRGSGGDSARVRLIRLEILILAGWIRRGLVGNQPVNKPK